jgi:uncharacterized membrane protein
MDTMPSALASTAVLSSGMVAAVLVAAAMHATWNAIAHGIGDRLVGFALMGVVDVVIGGAVVAVIGLSPTGAWPFIVVSAVTHVVYNVFLMISYQLGDFSQTDPLARGISPVVVAAVSILLLNRVLTAAPSTCGPSPARTTRRCDTRPSGAARPHRLPKTCRPFTVPTGVPLRPFIWRTPAQGPLEW